MPDRRALAAVVAAGLLLRLWQIGKSALEIEQATWFYYATRPTGEMLKWLGTEITGTLDVLALHALSFATSSPVTMRICLLAFFPPTVWFMYKISELVFDDARPGLYAAFLFSISPLSIHHAQLLRYHSQAMFLTVGAMMFFLRYLSDGKRLNLLLFTIMFAASALTHYYALALLPALASGAIVLKGAPAGTSRRAANGLLAAGVALLILSPVFISQINRRVGGSAFDAGAMAGYIFSGAIINIPDAVIQFLLGGHFMIHDDYPLARGLLFSAVATLAALLAALLGQRLKWISSYKRRFFFVVVAAAVFLPFFSVPIAGMPYVPKFLMPYVPLFFLLISGILADIKPAISRNLILGALSAVMLVSLGYYYKVLGPEPTFKDAVEYLNQNAAPGDTIVISPGYYYMVFQVYGPPPGRLLAVPQGDFLRDMLKGKDVTTPESMEKFGKKYLKDLDRVWVFYGDGSGEKMRVPADPDNSAYKWFEKRYSTLKETNFYVSPIKPSYNQPIGIIKLYERK